MKILSVPLFFIIFFDFSSCIHKNEYDAKKLSLTLNLLREARSTDYSIINKSNKKDDQLKEASPTIDSLKIKEAIAFCKKHNLDNSIAFLVDMSIHSGRKRFFIVDLQSKKNLYSGLCCHGMGLESTCSSPVFSNVKGSNCTSLGKYKTGLRSYSNWGINIHYKMHGLEKTNDNAFSRIVVLHSYDLIPEEEIYPDHLPMGWSQGCPVISNQLMTSIDKLLKSRNKPVLLWIYK